MKILIINVSLRPESKLVFFPLGLAYIASAIKRQGFDISILDIDLNRYSQDYIESYLKSNKFDVVCMGCIITGYKYIKQLSQLIRQIRPNAKIIVGNSVASSIPDILLAKTEVDIAVIGEGDVTIVELLNTLNSSANLAAIKGIAYKDNGKIVKTSIREPIESIDEIPFPEWELFDMEKYIESCSRHGGSDPLPIARDKIRSFAISTARGCPFRCTFCYNVFRGLKHRYISPTILAKEIKKLKEKYRLDYFIFNDDLTIVSKKHAQEIVDCFLQQNLNIFWEASCRADLFNKDSDLELALKLKAAGCVGLAFSLENVNPEILKMMNKKINPELFSKQCQILNKGGINSWTSLVFGYPIETKESIDKTIDCCIQNGIYPSAGFLLPQPATPIYEYAVAHGFINDEEEYLLKLGDRQDLRLNMTKMSDKEFEDVVVTALGRASTKLKLNMGKNFLLKTGHYRSPKVNKDALTN